MEEGVLCPVDAHRGGPAEGSLGVTTLTALHALDVWVSAQTLGYRVYALERSPGLFCALISFLKSFLLSHNENVNEIIQC